MKLGLLASKETQAILKELMSRPMAAKVAFRLKTSIKRAHEELAKYDETREQVLQKHGKKNSKGGLEINTEGNVQFSQEGMRAFIAEMTELNNLDVEIPTLSIDEFDGVEFTGEELTWLDGLIV